MPIGELETHPYLEQGQIRNATRLILGSFPVYECTNPDNDLKQTNRHQEGTVRFFYGSTDSSFWSLYSAFLDPAIQLPPNPTAILTSLAQRQIAITDLVISCERWIYKTNKKNQKILYPYSSEDSALHDKEWNTPGIHQFVRQGVRKVLCTSMGVLCDLEEKVLCPAQNAIATVDDIQSQELQEQVINLVGGNLNQVINPIARVFRCNNAQIIKAIAIPSPGSPQRHLSRFGFDGEHWHQYANNYFEAAFQWLTN